MLVNMANSARRCRPLSEWPEPDRAAWAHAHRPKEPTQPGGLAAHWSSQRSRKAAIGYGRFLSWLGNRGWLAPEQPSGDRVTPVQFEAYISDLSLRNRGFTVYRRSRELYDAIRVMAPDRDWRWLQHAVVTLRSKVRHVRNKLGRLSTPSELVALGQSLMAEAEAAPRWTLLRRAVRYRDGLMIAVLGHSLLPLRNHAAIAVERHLRKVGGLFWLHIAPSETKTQSTFETALPEGLSVRTELYLRRYRPILLSRAGRSPAPPLDALWISEEALPMTERSVQSRVRAHTRAAFGEPLPPQWFRVAGGLIEDPALRNAWGISDHPPPTSLKKQKPDRRTAQAIAAEGEVNTEAPEIHSQTEPV